MKKVLSLAFVGAMALTAFGIKENTSKAAVTLDNNRVSVVAGDTYKSIAASKGVSIADLERANGRAVGGFDLIFPGEIVKLPTAVAAPQQPQQQAPVQAPAAKAPVTQAPAAAAPQQRQQTQAPATTANKGQFKISFYDPAVLGSNMGYGGVAADFSIFPRGTRLKITTAQGQVWYRTVNDTGTFIYSNPRQLDMAMPNSSIPSYGVTTATVEVVG